VEDYYPEDEDGNTSGTAIDVISDEPEEDI
jgi:hypothetical protein